MFVCRYEGILGGCRGRLILSALRQRLVARYGVEEGEKEGVFGEGLGRGGGKNGEERGGKLIVRTFVCSCA